MGFLNYKDKIEEGDLVIIYISQESLIPMTVVKDGTNQTKFGIPGHNKLL